MKLNKNKKADFLIKNVLEIVLAVIGVMLLIFLGVKLIPLIFPSSVEKAESSLNLLFGLINQNLNQESVNEVKVFIPNPKGWYFFGTLKGDSSSPIKECRENPCICICSEGFICTEKAKGVCYPFDFDDYTLSYNLGALEISSNGLFLKVSFDRTNKIINIAKK
jgi:hypothetical protein